MEHATHSPAISTSFNQVAALRAAATLRVGITGLRDDQDELSCKLIADVGKGTLVP